MKRISESDIVKVRKPTFFAGDPEILLYDPSSIIVVGEDTGYESTGKSYPAGNSFFKTSASKFAISETQTSTELNTDLARQGDSDVPQLADIESVTITKYFDPVTKVEKAKAVIKIRNSSTSKGAVAGVDARIYQPRGI